eukprot:6679587-Alexandrium_andersonii.AAC.1
MEDGSAPRIRPAAELRQTGMSEPLIQTITENRPLALPARNMTVPPDVADRATLSRCPKAVAPEFAQQAQL